MTPAEFIAKWSRTELTERSAAQQHFLDLCDLLDHPKPAAHDPTGESFTFERGAAKQGGGDGWADVWKRDYFGWEYKGKHKDLKAAYQQLLRYRESLDNPPLLVVCDMDRIEVHTNFTGTAKHIHAIPLAELGAAKNLDIVRAVFFDPERLHPRVTREAITKDAATRLAAIAQALRDRGMDPQIVARFLDRIVFCLFAEDIGLLPKDIFARITNNAWQNRGRFSRQVGNLFVIMADGGEYGAEIIRHFDGNLFDTTPVLDLTPLEVDHIRNASKLDWGAIDPSILGTLFERGLDPSKRSQLGAHYTSREDIETIVEPVVMQPLRREWDAAREQAGTLLATGKKADREKADRLLHGFVDRLGTVTVLDPACGSGNFLYVTLQCLKDLEKEVIDYALSQDFAAYFPVVGPWQLYGIEIDPYAHDLAQTTVWIGYLQWMNEHGYPVAEDPVLRATDNFQNRDAILDLTDPENPAEPEWPEVDFIVGNPPFLGGKRLRTELGTSYVDSLFVVWANRVRPESDKCCYWFEKARAHIEVGKCKRAGLLATQGIRGGANREVLKRIKETGDIFFAVSDRDWVLEGANVHVSLICFDAGTEGERILDGRDTDEIGPALTTGVDISAAQVLPENTSLSFMGVTPAGPFDFDFAEAIRLLMSVNPNLRPTSDVVRPFVNGSDITTRPRDHWSIDFTDHSDPSLAALYEAPFERLASLVRPMREHNRRDAYRSNWWLYAEQRPAMRLAILPLTRFLVTATTSKHRLFDWLTQPALPDHALIVFARDDDYFFGVLHSRIHEVWARALGTQVRERESGFRYTPTTCFETFPFPHPTPDQVPAIAVTAKEIDRLRSAWLNPPEWTIDGLFTFPGSTDGPWARYVHDPDARGIGEVRYPRVVPKDAESAISLRTRTLTNLYNSRPEWLARAHARLDEAVAAAYGWPVDLSDQETLARLLALNLERA